MNEEAKTSRPHLSEADTRAELIDPALEQAGWSSKTKDVQVLREHQIKKLTNKQQNSNFKPDYVLQYKDRTLAVVEAKASSSRYREGIAQAKHYAQLLKAGTAYATNGNKIYRICMQTGREAEVLKFESPQELWNKTFCTANTWRDTFTRQQLSPKPEQMRFYQEAAINSVLDAVAENKKRILLTMATGTGKTSVALQIVWKLFHARWNLKNIERRPRVLFLTDRNVLARQAYTKFLQAFDDDVLERMTPSTIRKKGEVPKSASIYFTIFQTFMSAGVSQSKNNTPHPANSNTTDRTLAASQTNTVRPAYFYDYSSDFFDFIIVDECHRGGANDESQWRGILDYFAPAVQLGLTATPKHKDNANTYEYFGRPVYQASTFVKTVALLAA